MTSPPRRPFALQRARNRAAYAPTPYKSRRMKKPVAARASIKSIMEVHQHEKKLLFACAALAAAIFLAACGQGNAAQGSGGSERATLRVLSTLPSLLAEKHPEIALEWERVERGTGGTTDFHPKMQAHIQPGLPDIMVGKGQDIATCGSQGFLADMTGKSYLNEVMEAALESVALDGKIYGFPYEALYQGGVLQ